MTEVNNELIQAVLQIIRTAKPVDAASDLSQTTSNLQQQAQTVYDRLVPGQQYQATVLNPDVDGKALLRILGEKVLVETALPLKQGQHLLVEVISKNSSLIELQLKLAPTQAEIQSQYLKLNLPKQEPISNLLKSLNDYLVSLPEAKTTTVSQTAAQLTTRQLLTQLLSQIPTTTDIKEPAVFQKLLSDSGLFLESKLGHHQIPANDLKASLLKIADQLRPQLQKSMPYTSTMNQQPPAGPLTSGNRAEVIQQINTAVSQTAGKPTPSTATTTVSATTNTTATTATTAAAGGKPAMKDAANPTQQPGTVVSDKPAPQVANSSNQVSQIKSVTDKPGLTATQAAQKAIMLGKSNPLKMVQTVTSNLLSNSTIQHALSLLPKTEVHLLIKELLFKNTSTASRPALGASTGERLTQLAQLLRSVESGLARIQTQQLASVPQDDSTRQTWQLEIPLRNEKEMHGLLMRLEQDDDKSNEDNDGSTWTISLNLDIGKTGRIHSKIKLTSEFISTHFWSEQEKTAQKISANLPRLEKALEKLGLSVNHMTSSLGKPPDPVEMTATENSLLDENA